MTKLGTHVLVDATGADPELLDDVDVVGEAALEAARVAGATVLRTLHNHFSPQGVTVLLLLAESHLSVHTWPELGAYAADIFTCGDCDALAGSIELERILGGDVRRRTIVRKAR